MQSSNFEFKNYNYKNENLTHVFGDAFLLTTKKSHVF